MGLYKNIALKTCLFLYRTTELLKFEKTSQIVKSNLTATINHGFCPVLLPVPFPVLIDKILLGEQQARVGWSKELGGCSDGLQSWMLVLTDTAQKMCLGGFDSLVNFE